MGDERTLDVVGGEVFLPATPGQIRLTHVLYLLHAIGLGIGIFSAISVAGAFVFCWPSIIAIVLNYVKREEVAGSILASHFIWQADTFWRCAIALLVGFVLYLLLVGFLINWLIFGLTGLWVIHRIAKGWLALRDGKPV